MKKRITGEQSAVTSETSSQKHRLQKLIDELLAAAMNESKPSTDKHHQPIEHPDRRTMSNGLLRIDVTETDSDVLVHLHIPSTVNPRKLQLFTNGVMFQVEGPLGNRQVIQLPAPVTVKSDIATFHDNVIELRLRKAKDAYKELYVQYP